VPFRLPIPLFVFCLVTPSPLPIPKHSLRHCYGQPLAFTHSALLLIASGTGTFGTHGGDFLWEAFAGVGFSPGLFCVPHPTTLLPDPILAAHCRCPPLHACPTATYHTRYATLFALNRFPLPRFPLTAPSFWAYSRGETLTTAPWRPWCLLPSGPHRDTFPAPTYRT